MRIVRFAKCHSISVVQIALSPAIAALQVEMVLIRDE